MENRTVVLSEQEYELICYFRQLDAEGRAVTIGAALEEINRGQREYLRQRRIEMAEGRAPAAFRVIKGGG